MAAPGAILALVAAAAKETRRGRASAPAAADSKKLGPRTAVAVVRARVAGDTGSDLVLGRMEADLKKITQCHDRGLAWSAFRASARAVTSSS